MSSALINSVLHSAIYRVNTGNTLYEFIQAQKDALSHSIACLTVEEASYQIDLALQFMKFYMEQEKNDGLLDEPGSVHRVIIDTRKSVFEILLDLHSSMRATCVGFNLYFAGADAAKDSFIRKLLEFTNFDRDAESLNIPQTTFDAAYCTMVVFDSGDIESATDILANAWMYQTVPWIIRNILVQETIQEKFIQILESKLKPFQDNIAYEKQLRTAINKASAVGLRVIQNAKDLKELKPTIVFGSSVDFFLESGTYETAPIMVMNVFRTAKEAITMANKSNGGSISLWTEELSLAFEVAYALTAQTIWANTYATFNPEFPYTFRRNDFCYGSEYAVLEKKVKRVFVPSSKTPENSVEKNRMAIGALGVIPIEVKNQSYSSVRNKNNVHYEMVSMPYNIENYGTTNKMEIVEDFWDKYSTIDCSDRHIVMDTVHNARKTVVIPYGVSYAN